MNNCRDEFEKWAISETIRVTRNVAIPSIYESSTANMMWEAWQARQKEIDRLKSDMQQILESHDMEQAQAEAAEKLVVELATAYKAMREALADIARTEQAHCYGTDNEVNDLMQTRFDLRKCGDIARSTLTKYPEVK